MWESFNDLSAGDSLFMPGQVIEPEHLEYVRWALREKLRVQGVSAEEKLLFLRCKNNENRK